VTTVLLELTKESTVNDGNAEKKPDISDPILRENLPRAWDLVLWGTWPNDLLYIFPVVILGTGACIVVLLGLRPCMSGEPANPFATPLKFCQSGTCIPSSKFCGPFPTNS